MIDPKDYMQLIALSFDVIEGKCVICGEPCLQLQNTKTVAGEPFKWAVLENTFGSRILVVKISPCNGNHKFYRWFKERDIYIMAVGLHDLLNKETTWKEIKQYK